MAKEVVLRRMAMKTVYSQKGDVAKDHNLVVVKSFKSNITRIFYCASILKSKLPSILNILALVSFFFIDTPFSRFF